MGAGARPCRGQHRTGSPTALSGTRSPPHHHLHPPPWAGAASTWPKGSRGEMGWLSSHTELLPKLWGARRSPPPPPTLSTFTVAPAQAWESHRAHWGLGDTTFGTAAPRPRSPRQQEELPAGAAQAGSASPATVSGASWFHSPAPEAAKAPGDAGAEAAGPAVTYSGAGGAPRVPAKVRACPCAHSSARAPIAWRSAPPGTCSGIPLRTGSGSWRPAQSPHGWQGPAPRGAPRGSPQGPAPHESLG